MPASERSLEDAEVVTRAGIVAGGYAAWLLSGALLSAILYVGLLYVPLPMSLRFGLLPAVAAAGSLAVCMLVLVRPAVNSWSRARAILFSLAVVTLFGLAQRTVWGEWPGIPWSWLGLFPSGDSSDYFNEALGLLVHGEYDSLRGRPLHTTTLAWLLHTVDFELPLAGALATALACGACIAAGFAVWHTHGLAPASVFVAIMFAFYHYFVGSLMTETTGFSYGALAFALAWLALQHRTPYWFIAGIAALAVAQCVRVGPLFMLGTLLLVLALAWRTPRGVNWKAALAAGVLVLAVFTAHGAFNRMLAPASGGSFANAADSIYRLVVQGEARLGRYPQEQLRGSAPWLQIYDDHPGLAEQPQTERVARKKAILVDALMRSPDALLAGGLTEWNEYFFDFQFLPFFSLYDNDRAALVMAVLIAIGLLRVLKAGRDRYRWYVLAANLGIFASVPFLVGGQTRVYAATIGFTAVLAALGVHTLLRWRTGEVEASAVQACALLTRWVAGAFGLLLMCTLVVAFAYGGVLRSMPAPASCSEGSVPIFAVAGPAVQLTAAPVVHARDEISIESVQGAAMGVRKLGASPTAVQVLEMAADAVSPLHLSYVANLSSGHGMLMVLEDVDIGASPGAFAACVRYGAALPVLTRATSARSARKS